MTPRTQQLIWSIAFFPLVFVASPWGAMALTDIAGLPEWDSVAGNLMGGALVLGAVALYSHCLILFKRIGGGTTGPIEETVKLVEVGPFRYTRNPIYLAYVMYFLGVFFVWGHSLLLALALAVFGFIHIVLVRWEEPRLVDRFGGAYIDYARRTPRWVPTRPG